MCRGRSRRCARRPRALTRPTFRSGTTPMRTFGPRTGGRSDCLSASGNAPARSPQRPSSFARPARLDRRHRGRKEPTDAYEVVGSVPPRWPCGRPIVDRMTRGNIMDYFQGVVTEFLRADRAMFVNSECLLQLDPRGRRSYQGKSLVLRCARRQFSGDRRLLVRGHLLVNGTRFGSTAANVERSLAKTLRRYRARLLCAFYLASSAVALYSRGSAGYSRQEARGDRWFRWTAKEHADTKGHPP
jgi:hypothetical protein